MEFNSLTGPEKAGILIMSLPEEAARAFIERLDDDEVQRIMTAISLMGEVSPGLQRRVIADFEKTRRQQETSIAGGRERAADLIQRTVGGDRAERILARLGSDGSGIDWTLRAFEAPFIAETLREEHPQTIALILSQLPADRGAAVIAELEPQMRSDVVLRLADLVEVGSDLIASLEETVAELFGARLAAATRVGGCGAAAHLLKRVPSSESERILESLEQRDPTIASSIRSQMLTFNDLLSVDDRGFQLLLREVPTEDLVVALKTATEEMAAKVFSNLSKRAGDQLREELELLGPMKLKEVEEVQERVVNVARSLADEGVIDLNMGDSDDVLV